MSPMKITSIDLDSAYLVYLYLPQLETTIQQIFGPCCSCLFVDFVAHRKVTDVADVKRRQYYV